MKFSVIVPTYNGEAFVADALRSVFGQTLLPEEIIVVDDGSTDGTCEAVEARREESRVPFRLIRVAKNSGGPARPINIGIAAATQEYIAVLDQDDVFVPTRLETHAAALDACREASFAFSWCADFSDQHQLLQSPRVVDHVLSAAEPMGAFRYINSRWMFARLLGDQFIWGYPGFSFRRRDWREKGGVDESLRITSDYEMLLWLASRGPAVLVPSVGYLRRTHRANLTRDKFTTAREMHGIRLKTVRGRMKLFPEERLGDVLAQVVLGGLGHRRQVWNYPECLRESWCLLGLPGARLRFFAWHAQLPVYFLYRAARRLCRLARMGRSSTMPPRRFET